LRPCIACEAHGCNCVVDAGKTDMDCERQCGACSIVYSAKTVYLYNEKICLVCGLVHLLFIIQLVADMPNSSIQTWIWSQCAIINFIMYTWWKWPHLSAITIAEQITVELSVFLAYYFLFGFCQQNYTNSYRWSFMKFLWGVVLTQETIICIFDSLKWRVRTTHG